MRLVLCLLLVSCGFPENGTGRVEATLRVDECRPSGDFAGSFSFDAQRLGTTRFEQTLHILVQDHGVDLEETDGLVIRIDDVRTIPNPVRTSSAVVRAVDRSAKGVNATLSLFEKCPQRPQLHVDVGTLSLTDFTISSDPDDTGIDEAIAGTLSGSLVGADGETPAGSMTATFDFRPDRRLISEP